MKKKKEGKWKGLYAIAAAQFVDFGEGSALSTLFPAISKSLGLNVGHLGTIGAVKKIVGFLFAPIWGMVADKYSRKAVLVWATGVWGIWTFLIGFSTSYKMMLILTIISGIGLVALQSPLNSLISDMFPEKERGRAFGIVRTISFIGTIAAVLLFGQLAGLPDLGWRIAFWTFGGLSVLSGLLILIFVKEPERGQAEEAVKQSARKDGRETFKLKNVPGLFKIPTLFLLLLEYIPNTFVFTVSISFLVTWLAEDRGFSPGAATTTYALLVVGLAIGSSLGGILGDKVDAKNPKTGRLMIGHVSIFAVAIITFFLFQIQWESSLAYFVLVFLLGLVLDFRYSSAIAPITSAIIVPELRTTGFSLIQAMYTVALAIASFVIGRLGVSLGLTGAFLWTATGAAVVNALVWFLFYPIYSKDAERVQKRLSARLGEPVVQK